MTIHQIGTTFQNNSQWCNDEKELVANVKHQIDQKFPNDKNLLINTTWFGPQFERSDYFKLSEFSGKIDKLFFLASVDSVMLNQDQLTDIASQLAVSDIYYIGNFEGQYEFTFISTLLPKYFKKYTHDELILTDVKWIFLSYNRKPREHRTEFVNKLLANKLDNVGIVTLGNVLTLGEKVSDYAKEANWNMPDLYGIPHDIHSLGNMYFWQNHFLNIVGETEFNPWDNMFITEKTWKPIIGLRPFVINGQTKIYKWLRDNGFKTFNNYFNGIELENISEHQTHDSIIGVITYVNSLSKQEMLSMYANMLPDLVHNQQRFFEFVSEQKHKINNLFNEI